MNNFMFNNFNIIFGLVSALILGVFIFTIISKFAQWSSNNSKPVETKSVMVVTKRSHTWRQGGAAHRHARTSYYVTFELENKERIEMHVNSKMYGSITEGDVGMLKFQGTRFHHFERSRW